jgi:hypothetical protein
LREADALFGQLVDIRGQIRIAAMVSGIGPADIVGHDKHDIGAAPGDLCYYIPWGNLALIAAIAYGASLLTTYLPARQAADRHNEAIDSQIEALRKGEKATRESLQEQRATAQDPT